MNCQQVEKMLPLYAGHDLGRRDEQLVAVHLQSCTNCSRTAADYGEAQKLLHEFTTPLFSEDVYAGIRQNVWRQIETQSRRESTFPSLFAWLPPGFAWGAVAILLIVFSVAGLYLIRKEFNGRHYVVIDAPGPLPQNQKSPDASNEHEDQQPQRQAFMPKRPRKVDRLRAPDRATTAVAYSPDPQLGTIESRTPAMPPDDNIAGDTGKTLRLELQTKNPNIRIIWFTQRDRKPAAALSKGT